MKSMLFKYALSFKRFFFRLFSKNDKKCGNEKIPFNRPYMVGKELWYISQAHHRGQLAGDGRFIGFATCSFEGAGCEGVLYGVIPSASGGGIYSDLVRFTQLFFKKGGFATMKVSTQVDNCAVQKVWTREGFFINQAFLTVHINSLMNVSKLPFLLSILKGSFMYHWQRFWIRTEIFVFSFITDLRKSELIMLRIRFIM